jgi:hypothetical protein
LVAWRLLLANRPVELTIDGTKLTYEGMDLEI